MTAKARKLATDALQLPTARPRLALVEPCAAGQTSDHLEFALKAAQMYVWERDLSSISVTRFGDPAGVIGWTLDTIEDFIAKVHLDDQAAVTSAIDAAMLHAEPYELEFRIHQPDGSMRWVRDIGRRIETATGDRFLGVCLNVTKEVEARRIAMKLAFHDGLTGLPNRTLLHQRLDQEAAAMQESGTPLAVLCVDLDEFKSVNDTFGHAAGDDLLQQVGLLFESLCRPGDTVARTGGDEFVFLLPGATIELVEQIARTLFTRAQSAFTLAGIDAFIGFSIGAALGPNDGANGEALLLRADIALYRAKARSRGGLCFFQLGMDEQAQRRRRLEMDLRVAVQRGELRLVYQPLVSITNGLTEGVEALLRWDHGKLGPISPVEFIPIAESSGLIVPIGEWVLRTACLTGAAWGICISVNVSAVQFRQPGFVGMVVAVLAESGLPAGQLEIEITESLLINETEEALVTFARLKEIGVRIAMDDFGTGYSSLSYLPRFAFDKIKIDGSFTRSLGSNREAEAIVRAVVSLGASLQIRVNAEGVETEDQLSFLAAEGCDEAQGYLLSRPVDAAAIGRRLQAGVSEARRPIAA